MRRAALGVLAAAGLVVQSDAAVGTAFQDPPAGSPPAVPVAAPVVSPDRLTLSLNGRIVLASDKDRFMSIRDVKASPAGDRYLVVACGYECNDNLGFVLSADGTEKKLVTAQWDYILQGAAEWSADGRYVMYHRIVSSGAEPPPPPPGTAPPRPPASEWVQVDVATGIKGTAFSRRLRRASRYAVLAARARGGLKVRASAGSTGKVVAMLPETVRDVRVTGGGLVVEGRRWVPIRHESVAGWVDQEFLVEEPALPWPAP